MWSVPTIMIALALGGCGAESSEEQRTDEEFLRVVAQQRFARDGYTVTQAEFQGPAGDRWYVVQLDDPTLVVADRGYSTLEGIFERPMQAYADVLSNGEIEKMDDVNTFILSFRDDSQSVIDIPAGVMRDWVTGRLSLAELRERVTVSALTGP